jgi:N-acetylneuraminic acid mutarotase
LDDGGVLVTGGQIPAVASAERYDPASTQWTLVASMTTARRGHTATRLADGRVLITGGLTCCGPTGEAFANTAEIYDPRSNLFRPTGSLLNARAFHAATLLADGRVLVTGGFTDAGESTTKSAEIYDPASGQFAASGPMQSGRFAHASILLTDGRVLVLGGPNSSALAELFDPRTGAWSPGPTPAPARAATATLLSNGKVLVFGGEDSSGFPAATVMLFE